MHSNLHEDRSTFVTHLECAMTGERHEADVLHGLSRGAGKPLLVRYDLDGVRAALSKQVLAQRPPDFWRYRELLLCPEGAATYAAYGRACADGRVSAGETALLFICATGLKYPMPPSVARIDCRAPIDWAGLRS